MVKKKVIEKHDLGLKKEDRKNRAHFDDELIFLRMRNMETNIKQEKKKPNRPIVLAIVNLIVMKMSVE